MQTPTEYKPGSPQPTQALGLDWIHPAGPRAQIEVQINAARAHYLRNQLQNGGLYSGSATYERALSAQAGASVTLDVARQAADVPGYATWSGGGSLLGWRTIGRTTLFASVGLHWLEGDERLFLFPDRPIGVFIKYISAFSPKPRLAFEQSR